MRSVSRPAALTFLITLMLMSAIAAVLACTPPARLVYQDRTEQVPRGGVDQGLIRDLGTLINRVVADEPAVRVPSTHECGSCPIADCPERVASPQCRAGPDPPTIMTKPHPARLTGAYLANSRPSSPS